MSGLMPRSLETMKLVTTLGRIPALLGAGLLLLLLSPMRVLAGTDPLAGAGMMQEAMGMVVELGVILFVARLGNYLFERFGLAGVLGEMLAGMLVGGALSQPDALLSPAMVGVFGLSATLLVFMLGLETDLRQFLRYPKIGALTAVGGMALSFVVGDVMAVLLSGTLQGEQAGFLSPQSIVAGIIAASCSITITSRVIRRRKKTDSPEGVVIYSAAVINEILGIILLAAGVGIAAAGQKNAMLGLWDAAEIATRVTATWFLAIAIGICFSRRISVFLKYFNDRVTIAVLSLCLSMVVASLFKGAGPAMIVGAYVIGLTLSETDVKEVVREELQKIRGFLSPAFFAMMGMLVDLRYFSSWECMGYALLYTLAVGGAAILGYGLPAMALNFNWRGGVRVGLGMLPRSELALIVAVMGLATNLISKKLFGVVVFMAIFTSFLGQWLLSLMLKDPKSGVRKPLNMDMGVEHVLFNFPSFQITELMISRLNRLFELDGYFVHLLDADKQLYQIRKDHDVIEFLQSGTDLDFECKPEQVSFITTAVFEASREVEETAQELKKQLDGSAIARRVQEVDESRPAAGRLLPYLDERMMVPALKGSTRQEIIEELTTLLKRGGGIREAERACNAVLRHEQVQSSALQHGLAIPHARSDSVSELICAIGLKADGVDCGALDGKPTRVVVLTLSPRRQPTPHLQLISDLVQLLDETTLKELVRCRTAEEMSVELRRACRRGYRGPSLDAVASGTVATESSRPTIRQQAELMSYLTPDLVEVSLKGTTKIEVIDELLGMLVQKGLVHDMTAARKAVMAREEVISTGLEHGVAIPHARTDLTNRLVCAIGLKKEGVDFGSLDSRASRIFVLTLSPPDRAADYMRVMAIISKILDEPGRERVLAANTNDELWNALTQPG